MVTHKTSLHSGEPPFKCAGDVFRDKIELKKYFIEEIYYLVKIYNI